MKSFFYTILLLLFLVVSYSCKKKSKEFNQAKTLKNSIRYAKGFDLLVNGNSKNLVIKSAYLNASSAFEYKIFDKKNNKKSSDLKNSIQTPIYSIVATSTTHIPMIELLNEEATIIGFPHSKYISSPKTRKRIDAGKITEIGIEGSLNAEILIDLNPELVVGYSIASADKSLTAIQNAGIPVIYNGDWLEKTPLGRAEWIKFFGALYDKSILADSIFNIIENNYLRAKEIALNANNKVTVLSGAIMSKDIWNLPAGESFVAQFLKDANTDYLWKNSKGNGSLSLSFESVFNKAKDADFWIAPGHFSTKNQLLNSNQLYSQFKAYKNDNIYTPSTKKGSSGGVIYYELAPTRPDLVLKDIIKITHPELLPSYKLTFFEKMK